MSLLDEVGVGEQDGLSQLRALIASGRKPGILIALTGAGGKLYASATSSCSYSTGKAATAVLFRPTRPRTDQRVAYFQM